MVQPKPWRRCPGLGRPRMRRSCTMWAGRGGDLLKATAALAKKRGLCTQRAVARPTVAGSWDKRGSGGWLCMCHMDPRMPTSNQDHFSTWPQRSTKVRSENNHQKQHRQYVKNMLNGQYLITQLYIM